MGIENTARLNNKTSLIPKEDFQIINMNFSQTHMIGNNSENKAHYSEDASLLLYALAMIFYGISNFQLKHIKCIFGESYDIFSFGIWRMIAFTLLINGIMKFKKIEVIPLNGLDKNILFWLGVRTIGQCASFIFFMGSILNLRVSTANCFVSMNPAAVLIISTFFLNEKFHIRYPIGIGICLIGVFIIIFNELNNEEIEKNDDVNILLGIFWGSLNLFTVAMLSVSSKILNKAKIGHENQCYYIGISNGICFFILTIFNCKLNYSFSFILVSAMNSVIFLAATFVTILALHGVDLNKTTPINYTTIVVSTILSVIIIGEPLFFTDVLGSLVILGYNIYNALFPIKA